MTEPFLGQIQAFGFNCPPRGWAHCDAQLLSISQNTALFSLLGTTFGGDGETTFGLPDLRGRSIVHVGTGPGLAPISWGQRGGAATHSLITQELASHNHGANMRVALAENDQFAPNNTRVMGLSTTTRLFASDLSNMTDLAADSASIQNTGSGTPFNIRSPFTGIYVRIALTGIFPSQS